MPRDPERPRCDGWPPGWHIFYTSAPRQTLPSALCAARPAFPYRTIYDRVVLPARPPRVPRGLPELLRHRDAALPVGRAGGLRGGQHGGASEAAPKHPICNCTPRTPHACSPPHGLPCAARPRGRPEVLGSFLPAGPFLDPTPAPRRRAQGSPASLAPHAAAPLASRALRAALCLGAAVADAAAGERPALFCGVTRAAFRWPGSEEAVLLPNQPSQCHTHVPNARMVPMPRPLDPPWQACRRRRRGLAAAWATRTPASAP
jgi:hypothetical protein